MALPDHFNACFQSFYLCWQSTEVTSTSKVWRTQHTTLSMIITASCTMDRTSSGQCPTVSTYCSNWNEWTFFTMHRIDIYLLNY